MALCAAVPTAWAVAAPQNPSQDPSTPSFEDLRRHTLARFSYGPSPLAFDEIQTMANLDAWFDAQLLAPPTVAPRRVAWIEENLNGGHPEVAFPPEAWSVRDLEQKQLYLGIESEYQVREVMTYFWENLFSTNTSTVFGAIAQNEAGNNSVIGSSALGYMWLENDTYRRHALTTYKELLVESFHSASMRAYLNVSVMYLGDANEDYARELLELHTLGPENGEGIASYTPYDVDAVAQLLTGQGVRRLTGEPLFNAANYNPPPAVATRIFDNPANVYLGEFTVVDDMGTGDNILALLDHLVQQPQTKHHICNRMIEFFVGKAAAIDSPLMMSCVAAWDEGDGDGNIKAILRTIRESLEFQDAALGERRVKTPLEYVLSQARLFWGSVHGPRFEQANSLEQASEFLRSSGQGLFLHPSPDGYPIASQAQVSTGAHYHRHQLAASLGRPTDPAAGHIPSEAANFELRFALEKATFGLFAEDPAFNVQDSADVALALSQYALGPWSDSNEVLQCKQLLNEDKNGNPSPWDPLALDAFDRVELACAYLAALPQSSEK